VAVVDGECYGVGSVVGVEGSVCLGEVSLDGGGADAEGFADLGVAVALCGEAEDLPLPVGEVAVVGDGRRLGHR
jgi:hypothetical protein